MYLFKKLSLVYSLQIFAVLILFFYPGCSSNAAQKEIKQDKAFVKNEKHTNPVSNVNPIDKRGATTIIINNREPDETKYASFNNPRK